MLRRDFVVLGAGLALSAGVLGQGSAVAAEEGFVPLFKLDSLTEYDFDPELWTVAEGTIIGTTDKKQIKSNSFFSTKKTYKNFVLKVDWKLRNGNSGIQLRSKQHDNHKITGYQADIADNDFLGILYEEGGRGILAQVADKAAVKAAVKKGDWNTYEITVDGNKIKQVLNGVTTIEFTDADEKKGAKEGVIALQIHVGPNMQIEFRNAVIKELP